MSSQPGSTEADASAPASALATSPEVGRFLTGGLTLAGVVSVAGAVVYLTLRVAASRFYGPFGLNPEDVGLGYAELLARSVVGVLIGGLISAALVAVVVGLSRCVPAFERASDWFEEADGLLRSSGRFVVVIGTGVVGGVAFVVAYTLLKELWIPLARVLQGLVALVFLASFARGPLEASATKRVAGVSAITLALGLTVAVNALSSVVRAGGDDAHAVRLGHVPTSSWLGVPSYPWSATVACFGWTGSRSKAKSGVCNGGDRGAHRDCVMYLGESPSAVFAYDPATHDTLRVPASKATIELLPDADHC